MGQVKVGWVMVVGLAENKADKPKWVQAKPASKSGDWTQLSLANDNKK